MFDEWNLSSVLNYDIYIQQFNYDFENFISRDSITPVIEVAWERII